MIPWPLPLSSVIKLNVCVCVCVCVCAMNNWFSASDVIFPFYEIMHCMHCFFLFPWLEMKLYWLTFQLMLRACTSAADTGSCRWQMPSTKLSIEKLGLSFIAAQYYWQAQNGFDNKRVWNSLKPRLWMHWRVNCIKLPANSKINIKIQA